MVLLWPLMALHMHILQKGLSLSVTSKDSGLLHSQFEHFSFVPKIGGMSQVTSAVLVVPCPERGALPSLGVSCFNL